MDKSETIITVELNSAQFEKAIAEALIASYLFLIVKLKWWEFYKRKRLNKICIELAEKHGIDY